MTDQFGTDDLLSLVDLLPRRQLAQFLRGGHTDPDKIEEVIGQTFAYMVGFQSPTTPGGLFVPTLLSANPDGSQGVWIENGTNSLIGVQNQNGYAIAQSATHAANTYVWNSDGNTYTTVYFFTCSVYGAGVMPTIAAPLAWSISSVGGVIAAGHITQGGGPQTLLPMSPGGVASPDLTDVTFTIADGGVSVSTDMNISAQTIYFLNQNPYRAP